MLQLNVERTEVTRLRDQNDKHISEINALRLDKNGAITKLVLERDAALKEGSRLDQLSKSLEAQLKAQTNETQVVLLYLHDIKLDSSTK